MQGRIKRDNPNINRYQLNEGLIIDMAKILMREMHVTPSIRRLALALNVEPIEINQYFDSKITLLNGILASLMDSLEPPNHQLHWQQSLLLLSENYLELLKNYSGLLEALIAMSADGPMSRFFDHFYKITSPLNLGADKQKNAFLLLLNFLHGLALLPPVDRAQHDLKALLAMYCKVIEDYKK